MGTDTEHNSINANTFNSAPLHVRIQVKSKIPLAGGYLSER